MLALMFAVITWSPIGKNEHINEELLLILELFTDY